MPDCTCPPMNLDYSCPTHGLKQQIAGSNRKAKNRLRHRSEKQRIREAFLAGIKAQRLTERPWCENCGVANHEAPLELHHLFKRSRGPRYDGEEYGVDRPQNLSLLCRRCHSKAESSPEWGRPDDARR